MNNKELIKQRIECIETILQDTNLIDFIAINLSGTLQTKIILNDNNQLTIFNGFYNVTNTDNCFIFDKIEYFAEYTHNDLYYHVISKLEEIKNKEIYYNN